VGYENLEDTAWGIQNFLDCLARGLKREMESELKNWEREYFSMKRIPPPITSKW